MPLSLVFVAAMPLAWLLPNHYFPWAAAWQEGAVMALLAAALLVYRGELRIPRAWALWCALAIASIVVQHFTGTILFGGDALIAGLFVASFALATALGNSMSDDRAAIDAFALGVLAAAIASAGLALAQLAGLDLGLYGMAVKPGGRPYANLAQPNQLCSALFMGVCAVALLFERHRINCPCATLAAAFLMVGMVASTSRTGWMQIGAIFLLGLLLRRRVGARMPAAALWAGAAMFVALSLTWPSLNDALLGVETRALAEQAQGGVRLRLWQAMGVAVAREPLVGYGWQQVSVAQLAVALDAPPVHRHFEHAHNLILDLLIWAGPIVGGALVAIAVVALARALSALHDPQALYLMVLVLGVVLHAMVELPLHYAYLLVPFGFALGALHRLTARGRGWRLRWPPVLGAVLAAVLAAIALEYLEAEQNHRLLRLESARIGVARIESEAPELRLLSQLGAFLRFARTEARPDMTPDELEFMRQVSERFAYPPTLLRYALANGLNGEPARAQDTMRRLCSVNLATICDEARSAWRQAQARYPQLPSIPQP